MEGSAATLVRHSSDGPHRQGRIRNTNARVTNNATLPTPTGEPVSTAGGSNKLIGVVSASVFDKCERDQKRASKYVLTVLIVS